MLPEAARHVKASEISYKITNPALQAIDRAVSRLSGEIAALRLKTAAPPASANFRQCMVAAEIRSTLASMSEPDRLVDKI